MNNRLIQVMGGVLGVLMLSIGPATAATASEAAPAEEHCAVETSTDLTQGMAAPVCFDTTDAVDDYLKEIVVGSMARGVAATTHIGTVYKNANGTGTSLAFYGSSGCAGVTFGFSSLAAGWDDSISSVRGSNGCWVSLYTATSYGGSALNCTPYCSSIAGWNDNVKSLVFRPTGTFG